MTVRYLNRREVEARVSLSRSSIYHYMSRFEFPRPYALSKRGSRVAWREDEIENWICSRERQGGCNDRGVK